MMPDSMRVHVTGASGSGTTTLGVHLARCLHVPQFDTDAYFWLPTDPPFTTKRPEGERVRLLEAEFSRSAGWVLSGSLMGWADVLMPYFDLVVFLYVPPEARIARLMERERERFGDAIHDGAIAKIHRAFMDWAGRYDDPTFPGRSLHGHRAWLTRLDCPVVQIEGTPRVEESVERTMAAIASLAAR
jgi:adenylate kinase family enzyme